MGNSVSDLDCCSSKRGGSRTLEALPSRRGVAAPLFTHQESFEGNGVREEKVGVGAYFQKSDQDPTLLEVRSMLPGGAADRSGMIAKGDVLLKVDGVSVHGPSMSKVVSLLLGEEGSEVRVTLRRQGQDNQPFDVKLIRGALG